MTYSSPALLTLLLGLSFGMPTMAINPEDDYYSGDLYQAIQEAKKRPHHYNYSSKQRYNRSTTQSLNIPKLLNKEMGGNLVKNEITNRSNNAKSLKQLHSSDKNPATEPSARTSNAAAQPLPTSQPANHPVSVRVTAH